MVLTSFRREHRHPDADARRSCPTRARSNNYRKVFERDFFWTAMRNSLMVTLIVVVLALVIAFLAAVALSRFRFRGRKAFLVTVLVVQMIPAEALIISLFRVLDGWQLTNTIIGLSLTYLVFVLPFTIWTLRGFVGGVPLELEEAALVDGASRLRGVHAHHAAARRARPRRDRHLRLHPGVERVHLRPRDHEPARDADDAGVAAGVQRGRPRHRLGRGDGRLDADGASRS